MTRDDPYCHSASIEVDRPAETAFAFMADGIKQGQWAFGSWDRRAVADDVFEGTSLFSGEKTYVRIRTDPANLLILYDLGATPDPAAMTPRIMARILSGATLGMAADTCVVSLLAWRGTTMADRRWYQLCISHETEMLLIKHQIEGEALKGEAST